MSFLQIYYTSCEVGLRGGKGFQVNAATDGLDEGVLRQVERLGLYVPPLSAPSRPTPEEIESFPVSLLYQQLAGGAAVLAQARYVGTDYSGRYGNYFTHSLVTSDPDRDLRGQGWLPVELWRSRVWSTTTSETTSLAPLDGPAPGETVSPLLVEEFLQERGRIEHLPSFLTAISRALSAGRRVVIVDDDDAVALWVAAASYALPAHLALRLTFTTYVKNPYQSEALIVGTTPDSDFGFAPHEIEHQYSVFDFAGGRFTPTPEADLFAAKVAAAYVGGWDVAGFARFADYVAPGLPLEELDTAFSCYALISGIEVPGVAPAEVVRWSAGRLACFNAEQVGVLFSGVMNGAPPRREVIEACTGLYLAIQREPVHPSIHQRIEMPYLEWLVCGVSRAAPSEVVREVAARLVVPPRLVDEAGAVRPEWLRQLEQANGAERLCALLELGDKLGFLKERGEPLRRLGETVVAPLLGDPSVRRAVAHLSERPAIGDIFYGVGAAFSADRERIVARLESAGELIAEPAFFDQLQKFALENDGSLLYFCLVGRRAALLLLQQPDARFATFRSCIDAAKRFGRELSGQYADAAFECVWMNGVPTVEEAVQLLDLLRAKQIAGATFPRRLAALVVVPEDGPPTPSQRALADRLRNDQFSESLGDEADRVNAFWVAVGLQQVREDPAAAVGEALRFLEGRPPSPDEQLSVKVRALAAARLAHIKDVETHGALLCQAYKGRGGAAWLRSYGEEVKRSLSQPQAGGLDRRVARLFETWLAAEQRAGAEPARTLLSDTLPHALRGWHARELSEVDSRLRKDAAALQRWIEWREEFARRRGLFGRLKHLFHNK